MNDKTAANSSLFSKGSAIKKDSGEMISQKLRELYDSVCDEGVSDRFLDLLERLDEAEKKSGAGGSSNE